RLQVIQPALNALAMPTHPALALRPPSRCRPPPEDRREAGDELRDRAREASGALRACPPPQQPLDRAAARLDPIVPARATTARASRHVDQRICDHAPGLGRDGDALGRIPAPR